MPAKKTPGKRGNSRTITNYMVGLPTAKLDDFDFVQPDNLKTITKARMKKYKNQLIRNGIRFHVTVHAADGKPKKPMPVTAGKHKVLALRELRKEGYNVPTVPYVVQRISAATAKRAVLMDSGKYSQMTRKSLLDFAVNLDPAIEETLCGIPKLDFNADHTSEGHVVIIEFSKKQFDEFQEAMRILREQKNESDEHIIRASLRALVRQHSKGKKS